MELRIEKGNLIKDIQKEFNMAYPFLKIEFFKLPFHEPKRKLLKNEKITGAEPVSKSEKFLKSGNIIFNNKTTAAELENDFWEIFGLSIKLFRKSGTLWIETTLTDNWSLEKQNEEGAFMSAPVIHKNEYESEEGDAWREKE